MGAGLMASPTFQATAAALYGAQVAWTPALVYLVRILGSFAFVLGLLAVAAAREPLSNRAIIWGFATLFLLRDAHRVIFADEIQAAFALRPGVNALTNVFFLAQSVGLLVLLRLARPR